jgi:hypothetical protein
MRMFNLPDETLPAFYESIRRRVLADMKLGNPRRLAGASVKRYAQRRVSSALGWRGLIGRQSCLTRCSRTKND